MLLHEFDPLTSLSPVDLTHGGKTITVTVGLRTLYAALNTPRHQQSLGSKRISFLAQLLQPPKREHRDPVCFSFVLQNATHK